jgi:hypothetical protein
MVVVLFKAAGGGAHGPQGPLNPMGGTEKQGHFSLPD